MLKVMARTRPMRSPSQPNTKPPAAAPIRNRAVMRPIQSWTKFSSNICVAACISCKAGRATSGKIPICMPSNIQPRQAASRASHKARCRWALVAPLPAAAGSFRLMLKYTAPGYHPAKDRVKA